MFERTKDARGVEDGAEEEDGAEKRYQRRYAPVEGSWNEYCTYKSLQYNMRRITHN